LAGTLAPALRLRLAALPDVLHTFIQFRNNSAGPIRSRAAVLAVRAIEQDKSTGEPVVALAEEFTIDADRVLRDAGILAISLKADFWTDQSREAVRGGVIRSRAKGPDVL